jgi:hypothetical protein
MEIYCQVTQQGLVPMYDSDYEEKKKLKQGEKVLVTIKRPRNYENHKRFFALLRLVVQNLPEQMARAMSIYSEEDLLNCIKLDLGMFTTHWHEGRELLKVKSISFASMDESEFSNFFTETINLITNHYLLGMDKETLLEEIDNFR